MAIEARRGCGYRRVGGLYLCSDGIWKGCDRLPFPVGACPVCGEGIHYPRNMRQINPVRLFGRHENCRDDFPCQMCDPTNEVAFVLGVGEKYYTPQNFISEAEMMGVSKRIPSNGRPRNFEIGHTWVYLIHRKAIDLGREDGKEVYGMAIFAAFVPTRLEMPIWESAATEEYVESLKKRGITPVVIPDGDEDHKSNRRAI
jgi:hypothetical protein